MAALDGSGHAGRLDRLSPLDVSNLRVEDHGLPMHVAGLAILEGLPRLDDSGRPWLEALMEMLEQRLYLAPRFRQVLHTPPFGLGPPLWVDDPAFDIRRHVQTRAIPSPGNDTDLLEVCSDLNESPLDRSRPLWEVWVLTGLAEGRVGLLIRLHHVVADGIAALAMIGALLDTAPHVRFPPAPSRTPQPPPSAWELFTDNLSQRAAAWRRAISGFRHPPRLLGRLGSMVRQIRRLRREGIAPRVSLNGPVGRRRRLLLVRTDLERVKAIAHAHGAKVNDVVLTAVAGGARKLLTSRGELKPGLVLKASVATSIRDSGDELGTGNRVGIMIVPIPVGEPDPMRRLEEIARATTNRKRQRPYQPSARFSQRWMVRVMFRQRLVNLLTSNLPGPPIPMYFAGARVLELFQVGVVQGNIALGVGTISYAGRLNFDVIGDADIIPDLELFAEGLADTLRQLGIEQEGESTGSTAAAFSEMSDQTRIADVDGRLSSPNS